VFVLIDDCGGNFAGDDFAKYAVLIVHDLALKKGMGGQSTLEIRLIKWWTGAPF
jgi:hypothetical protein